MVNKIILIGNLGKDSETRKLDNGNSVTNFSLATTESWKDKKGEWQKETEWHSVVIWQERKYLKGDMVYVEGKIKTEKWQNKDGVDQYTTKIIANSIRKLSKSESTNTNTMQTPAQKEFERDPQKKFETDLPF